MRLVQNLLDHILSPLERNRSGWHSANMRWLLIAVLATGCAHQGAVTQPGPAQPDTRIATPLPVGSLADLLTAEVAIKRGDTATAYANLARQVEQTGDEAVALRAARVATQIDAKTALSAAKALAQISQSFEARALLARGLLVNQQIERAVIELRAAAEMQPDQVLGFLPRLLQGQPEWSAQLAEQLATPIPRSLALGVPLLYATEAAYGAERALPIAKRLTRQHPKRPSLFAEAARLAQQAEGSDSAIQILSAGIKQHPQDQSLLLTRTQLQVATQQYTDAINGFALLSRLDPDEPSYTSSQGMLAVEIEDFEQAERLGQSLLEQPATERSGRLILGLAATAQGSLERARQLLSTEQGDSFLLARTQLAQAYLDNNQIEQLESWLDEGRQVRPDQAVVLYLTQAELYSEANVKDRIVGLLSSALSEHPNNFRLLYARALYRDSGNTQDIVTDLKAALALEPDNASALNALGYTYADANIELDAALELIGRALAIRTDDAAILDSMGWVHYRLGNLPQALSWLERAFEQLPDAEIGAHLGEVLWVDQQSMRAREILSQALEMDPTNPVLLETLERLDIRLP